MNNLRLPEFVKIPEKYQLWAIWETHCWHCGQKIKVAAEINTEGFNPSNFMDGAMWSKSEDDKIESTLKALGANRKLKFSKTINDSYLANVCPYCDALQGDWFVQDEVVDQLCSPDESFKILLFKDSILIDTLPSVEKFKQKYWKMFLYENLSFLKKCKVCGCYITDDPSIFEEYLKKYPESNEILAPYGKIKKEIIHHLNYAKNITISVCDFCHAKIHHSEDPEYFRFHPVDKRKTHYEPRKDIKSLSVFGWSKGKDLNHTNEPKFHD